MSRLIGKFYHGQTVKVKPCKDKKERDKRAATANGYGDVHKKMEGKRFKVYCIRNKQQAYLVTDNHDVYQFRQSWLEPVVLTYKEFME